MAKKNSKNGKDLEALKSAYEVFYKKMKALIAEEDALIKKIIKKKEEDKIEDLAKKIKEL